MERFIYVDGMFFDRVSNTASEMARSLNAMIESVRLFKDPICGLSEEVKLLSRKLVVTTARPFGKDARQGIHLLRPSESELENAKQSADRDNFRRIYIHKG